MRKFSATLVVVAMAGAGLAVTGTPAMAVTAACTKAKSGQTGSATCRGAGGSWRLFLNCATGADYRSGWYVLTNTPRTVTGSCAPSPLTSVNVETKSTV